MRLINQPEQSSIKTMLKAIITISILFIFMAFFGWMISPVAVAIPHIELDKKVEAN